MQQTTIEIIDDNNHNNHNQQHVDIVMLDDEDNEVELILPVEERTITPVSLPIQEINNTIFNYLKALNPNIENQNPFSSSHSITTPNDPSIQKAARLFLFKAKRTFDKVYGPFKKSTISFKQVEEIDPSNVQVLATNEELRSRISKFVATKRSQIDESNVREFTTDTGDLISARTNPRQLRKRQQIKQSINEDFLEGSNTTNKDNSENETNNLHTAFPIVPPGVEERLSSIETHLNIPLFPPTPNEVFKRIKNIENKILALENMINTPLSTINITPATTTTPTLAPNIPSPATLSTPNENVTTTTTTTETTVSSPKPPKKLKKSVDDSPKTPQDKNKAIKQKKTPKQTSSPQTTANNTTTIHTTSNPLSPMTPVNPSITGNIGVTKSLSRKEGAPKVSGRGAGKTVKNLNTQNTSTNNNHNNINNNNNNPSISLQNISNLSNTPNTTQPTIEYQPIGYDINNNNNNNNNIAIQQSPSLHTVQTSISSPLSDSSNNTINNNNNSNNNAIAEHEKRINELLEKLRK